MRWLALSGLIALLPVLALAAAADVCPPPEAKVCDPKAWSCSKKELRDLIDQREDQWRDCWRHQADAAALADMSRIEPRVIASALYEIGLLSEGEWTALYKANKLDANVLEKIKVFQKNGDGWLRGEQFLRLICYGAGRGPFSKYFLGWMYGMGQGVAPSRPLARRLLTQARDVFQDRELRERQGHYTYFLTHIDAMLELLREPPGQRFRRGDRDEICPDFEKFRRDPPYGDLKP
jgi:hypothetical protein